MRAKLYRGMSLLLIVIMLFVMQPAAFGDELEESEQAEEDVVTSQIVEEDAITEDELPPADGGEAEAEPGQDEPAPESEAEAGEPEAETGEPDAEEESPVLWLETAAEPALSSSSGVQITGRALVLSDRIGLTFILDIPEQYRDGGSVRFSGARDDQSVDLADAEADGAAYRFTCWMGPLEMANEIRPDYYQNDTLVQELEASSVKAFIEAADEEDPARALLRALGDYGHFAQLGAGIAEPGMPQYREDAFDYDAICAALADQKMQWTPTGNVKSVNLRFDPELGARLSLSLNLKDGYTGTPAVSVYDKTLSPDGDGVYPLAAVKLNGLGTMLDVLIRDGGESAALKASALSVARDVLELSDDAAQRDFFAALYTLYAAAADYQAN